MNPEISVEQAKAKCLAQNGCLPEPGYMMLFDLTPVTTSYVDGTEIVLYGNAYLANEGGEYKVRWK